jgi:hypothetical protein
MGDPFARGREAAELFNKPDSNCDTLLTSYQCSAHGLNLHGQCSRVVLLEPPLNLNTLFQAVGQIYRIYLCEERSRGLQHEHQVFPGLDSVQSDPIQNLRNLCLEVSLTKARPLMMATTTTMMNLATMNMKRPGQLDSSYKRNFSRFAEGDGPAPVRPASPLLPDFLQMIGRPIKRVVLDECHLFKRTDGAFHTQHDPAAGTSGRRLLAIKQCPLLQYVIDHAQQVCPPSQMAIKTCSLKPESEDGWVLDLDYDGDEGDDFTLLLCSCEPASEEDIEMSTDSPSTAPVPSAPSHPPTARFHDFIVKESLWKISLKVAHARGVSPSWSS